MAAAIPAIPAPKTRTSTFVASPLGSRLHDFVNTHLTIRLVVTSEKMSNFCITFTSLRDRLMPSSSYCPQSITLFVESGASGHLHTSVCMQKREYPCKPIVLLYNYSVCVGMHGSCVWEQMKEVRTIYTSECSSM